MIEIDYGPIPPGLKEVLENIRRTMLPEKRLLMAKLLARTVATDGDDETQKGLAVTVDAVITVYFRERYP